jgi:uncharacterized small protein (DUF1192 family)
MVLVFDGQSWAFPTGPVKHNGREAAAMLVDDEPVKKAKRLIDEMSIDDIRERIVELKQEIALCEAAITRKEASRLAADAAFFKK